MSFKERFSIFVSCSGLASSETLSMYFDCPRKQSMTKSFFFRCKVHLYIRTISLRAWWCELEEGGGGRRAPACMLGVWRRCGGGSDSGFPAFQLCSVGTSQPPDGVQCRPASARTAGSCQSRTVFWWAGIRFFLFFLGSGSVACLWSWKPLQHGARLLPLAVAIVLRGLESFWMQLLTSSLQISHVFIPLVHPFCSFWECSLKAFNRK